MLKNLTLASLVAAAALALAAPAAVAQVVVMDFQGNATGPAPSTYVEDGIRLVATASNNSLLFNSGNPSPGYTLNSGDGGTATFSLVSGGAFDFESIDVRTQTRPFTLPFTGTYAAGGTVAGSFVSNGSSFTTYAPAGGFDGLSSLLLTFPAGGGVLFFDNVTLSVPEPSSLALLGLGGVALRRWRV